MVQFRIFSLYSGLNVIFFKRWEYQTTLPASWEIYIQVRKQQLEPDMEEQTGSILGKEYVKASGPNTSWQIDGETV